MMILIALLVVLLLAGVLAVCAWTSPLSPLLLRWLRGRVFLYVDVAPFWVWRAHWRSWRLGMDPLVGRFRRVEGSVMKRWGVFLWGLEIGDRGGRRDSLRHRMRLDPCPHAPFSPGAGCWMCQRQAPVAWTPPLSPVTVSRDGAVVATGVGWHRPLVNPAPGPAVALPPGLKHVRDLEAFDGPLLSEFTDAAGTSWVLKWAAQGDEAHRWLMVRSRPESITRYLDGALSMYNLLAAEGNAAMLVDYDGDQPRGAWSVSLSDPKILPYLPERDVMHDPELRPEMVS